MLLQPAHRRALHALVALRHEQVELARPQERDAVLGFVLAHGADELGMAAAQVGDRRDDEAGRGAGEGADEDLASHGLMLGGQICLGGVELREHAIGATHERVRGRRQAHAPAVALEQRHAHLALQLNQRLRDRGWGVADHPRHLGDGPAAGELAQQPQSPHVEHR